MASNIKFPESTARWFIEGDKLCLITKVDSSGNTRTSARKQWKAISEAVTNGILLHYYAEPNNVKSLNDEIDLYNTMHLALVDYVKKCLYMDKAGTATDAVVMQASMSLANKHERNFKDCVQRYGVRKKDKTGGSRVVKVPTLV